MEISTVTRQGIEVEKLTIGWLQLLGGAFVLGSFAYSVTTLGSDMIKVKAEQDALKSEYTKTVTVLTTEARNSKELYIKLNNTLDKLDTTLTTVTASREIEREERKKLTTKVENMDKDIQDLRLEVSKIKN